MEDIKNIFLMKQLVKATFGLRRIKNGIGILFFLGSGESLVGLSLVRIRISQERNRLIYLESIQNLM